MSAFVTRNSLDLFWSPCLTPQGLRNWPPASPALTTPPSPPPPLPRPGSAAAVLAQSERAVRGVHVHKMRCDEVEMFHPDIWAASQMVPKSTPRISGTVEALSTLHVPGGLMERIVTDRAAA